jgi:glycosyltransferase involved in cell wall biosynthesis
LNGKPGSIRYDDGDIERFRTPVGLRPIILWVGRFLEFKRVPVLLQAFALARQRMDPPPVLLMWGGYPGELEGVHPLELARTLGIENDTFFVGWRDHDDLVDALNCADLLVAPSVNESFGLVYIEAMACGTPPIATATGGPRDFIATSGETANGWTVRPDDPTDLANTICAALADPDEVLRRGRNGRTYAAREHGWSTVVDRYCQLYEQATGPSGV